MAPPKLTLFGKLRSQDSDPGVCNFKCVVTLCAVPPPLSVSSWVTRLEGAATWIVFAVWSWTSPFPSLGQEDTGLGSAALDPVVSSVG